jgi:nicotinate-nucleotide pyrophosphorylase
VTAVPPDRATILAAVMPDLLAVRPSAEDPEATDGVIGTIVAAGAGVLAGVPVAAEICGRLGVRCRRLVDEGAAIAGTTSVAEVGGAIAAVDAAATPALAWLTRLTAVATGGRAPEPGHALDAYAAGLSAADAAREGTPSFRLVIEGEG